MGSALQCPWFGGLLRQAATRRTLQTVLLLGAAGLIVLDGLLGPPDFADQSGGRASRGFTGGESWCSVCLVAGNFFCHRVCPFTLPRNMAKRIYSEQIVPGPLFCGASGWRSGLLALFFWAYEALALWDSPWWTAWIVVTYFAASFVS